MRRRRSPRNARDRKELSTDKSGSGGTVASIASDVLQLHEFQLLEGFVLGSGAKERTRSTAVELLSSRPPPLQRSRGHGYQQGRILLASLRGLGD